MHRLLSLRDKPRLDQQRHRRTPEVHEGEVWLKDYCLGTTAPREKETLRREEVDYTLIRGLATGQRPTKNGNLKIWLRLFRLPMKILSDRATDFGHPNKLGIYRCSSVSAWPESGNFFLWEYNLVTKTITFSSVSVFGRLYKRGVYLTPTFRLTLMTSSKSSSLCFRKRESRVIPAPLTVTLSGEPWGNSLAIPSTREFTLSAEDTSVLNPRNVASLWPLLLEISSNDCIVSWTAERWSPATATDAPSLARSWQTARPIPLPPPMVQGAMHGCRR